MKRLTGLAALTVLTVLATAGCSSNNSSSDDSSDWIIRGEPTAKHYETVGLLHFDTTGDGYINLEIFNDDSDDDGEIDSRLVSHYEWDNLYNGRMMSETFDFDLDGNIDSNTENTYHPWNVIKQRVYTDYDKNGIPTMTVTNDYDYEGRMTRVSALFPGKGLIVTDYDPETE